MNFTRTDANALLAIAIGSAVGMATLGPQAWLANELTTTTTTYTTYRTEASPAPDEVGEGVVVEIPSQTESRTRVRVRRGKRLDFVSVPAPSSEQPLIYVDGVRIEGALSDLDPDMIERVEVLKGDAALDVYGPEAASGVVQIYLKEPASPDAGAPGSPDPGD